ncbi:hypothetical protein I4U23_005358 [Adineta vaga]|nr:hypothetical protein I4U23_005358 [Adineta vaga]
MEQQTELSVNGNVRPIKYFVSRQSGGIDIRHYILAKLGSEADRIWNIQTIDGIMSFIQNTDNRRSLDLINDIISFINNKLSQLFVQNNNSSNVQQRNLQLVQHNKKPFIVLSDRKDLDDLSENPSELKLSEHLVYDDAGYFIRNESEFWQPRYNLYEDDTNYYLILELPGFKKGELKPVILENSITIEGSRNDMNTTLSNSIILQSDIPTGSFKLHISFQHSVVEQFTAERIEGFIKLTIVKKKSIPFIFEI